MRNLFRAAGFLLLVSAAHLVPVAPARSADWPQWRGPNRDGVVRGVKVPDKWPKSLTEEWKVEAGEGAASPVVVGDRVYVFTRQRDKDRRADGNVINLTGHEIVSCFDLATGREEWRAEYPAPYRLGGVAHGYEGPRSTPTVADGRVYTFGVGGILSCLDAKTGKLIWRKESVDYPQLGASCSPLVYDGLCVVHFSDGKKPALTAFDAATGDVKWAYDADRPSYGSPILVELAGERQVVTLTERHFLGVAAATGKLLWRIPCYDIATQNCVTPILYKDLLIYSGYKDRVRAVRLERGDKGLTATDVWKADAPTLYMSTPVVAGDYLFGQSEREFGYLFCLDAKTGKTLWRTDGRMQNHAHVLNATRVWLVSTNQGKLIVVKPGGKEYEVIAEYTVSTTGWVWAHPVFLGDRILVKDKTTLRSLAIKDDGKP
jgi:outer membrane protein assembly factor BamB